jgi:hypothetical protein
VDIQKTVTVKMVVSHPNGNVNVMGRYFLSKNVLVDARNLETTLRTAKAGPEQTSGDIQ